MSERDELVDLINISRTDSADRILAAGYRKPRTITAAEEPEALPKMSDGDELSEAIPGSILTDDATVDRIARVLHGNPPKSRPLTPESCAVCAESIRLARATVQELEDLGR